VQIHSLLIVLYILPDHLTTNIVRPLSDFRMENGGLVLAEHGPICVDRVCKGEIRFVRMLEGFGCLARDAEVRGQLVGDGLAFYFVVGGF